MSDIVVDPGLRKSIDEFQHGIRDDARRIFLNMGACQSKGRSQVSTNIG